MYDFKSNNSITKECRCRESQSHLDNIRMCSLITKDIMDNKNKYVVNAGGAQFELLYLEWSPFNFRVAIVDSTVPNYRGDTFIDGEHIDSIEKVEL